MLQHSYTINDDADVRNGTLGELGVTIHVTFVIKKSERVIHNLKVFLLRHPALILSFRIFATCVSHESSLECQLPQIPLPQSPHFLDGDGRSVRHPVSAIRTKEAKWIMDQAITFIIQRGQQEPIS